MKTYLITAGCGFIGLNLVVSNPGKLIDQVDKKGKRIKKTNY